MCCRGRGHHPRGRGNLRERLRGYLHLRLHRGGPESLGGLDRARVAPPAAGHRSVRASCPGWDGDHRPDAVRGGPPESARQAVPGAHRDAEPADAARPCPLVGACPDVMRKDYSRAGACRRAGACPGWARTGCSQAERARADQAVQTCRGGPAGALELPRDAAPQAVRPPAGQRVEEPQGWVEEPHESAGAPHEWAQQRPRAAPPGLLQSLWDVGQVLAAAARRAGVPSAHQASPQTRRCPMGTPRADGAPRGLPPWRTRISQTRLTH